MPDIRHPKGYKMRSGLVASGPKTGPSVGLPRDWEVPG